MVNNGLPSHRILNTSELARKLVPVQELPAGAFAVFHKGENMSEEHTYIGLDLSLTSSGFCRKTGKTMTIETIKTDPKNFKNDLDRLIHIRDILLGKIPMDVKMICVEDFFTPSNKMQIGSAIKLAMLGTTVRLALHERGLPFAIIAPSQLKKFVTGKGCGEKSMILREVYKRWGIDAKDDNQADATVLCYLSESIYFRMNGIEQEGLIKPQIEVISTVIQDRPKYNIKSKL
jgi:crossover junction endodeoxyribonuclease RuvC